jgi:hypothetical protein
LGDRNLHPVSQRTLNVTGLMNDRRALRLGMA